MSHGSQMDVVWGDLNRPRRDTCGAFLGMFSTDATKFFKNETLINITARGELRRIVDES